MSNKYYNQLEPCIERILKTGSHIVIATPLGLGKPNQLINAIYKKAKNNQSLKLEIHTALSLDRPKPMSDLEKRLSNPFLKRQFGENYPDLEYVSDTKNRALPDNIIINEFYFQSGSMLNIESAQKHYTSVNYTHVPRDMAERGVNVLLLLVSSKIINGKKEYSLSCNPDVTLDLVDLLKNKKPLVVAQIHPDLPFLEGEAHVPEDFFDVILDNTPQHKLFAIPKGMISDTDFAIGFHASTLIKDNGTLQIGIGSLSDSLVYNTILRNEKNNLYQEAANAFVQSQKQKDLIQKIGDLTPFKEGLFGASEMIMDGFMYLRKAGILKRTVDQNCYLRGAFFLGSSELYSWLSHLEGKDYDGLQMTRVTKINDLYGEEQKLRNQLINARFFNTCMNVSLLGAASSDGLESGQVVSGVGGQYNFVAMAHELENARSILMLRSTRKKHGKIFSNILWNYGYCTIPRHLRDIVITEYGARDIRGKSDEQIVISLIEISDSRFQDELIETAKKHGKLSKNYVLDPSFRQNLPSKISGYLKPFKDKGFYKVFPFGSEFDQTEQRLIFALKSLKKKSKAQLILEILKSLMNVQPNKKETYKTELERMGLWKPKGIKEKIYQKLLISVLDSD